MRIKTVFSTLLLLMLFTSQANAGLFGDTDPDEERAKIQEMRKAVLARLYEEKPEAKDLIASAKGYAVFDNTGINVFVVSTANGKGLAHNSSSGQETYMKMISLGGGIGLGIKTFSAVFVFHTQEAFDYFVEEGWDFSAQADAAATSDGEEQENIGSAGAAGNIDQAVTVYQMTDQGLALQATLQGTKYWQNEDLN